MKKDLSRRTVLRLGALAAAAPAVGTIAAGSAGATPGGAAAAAGSALAGLPSLPVADSWQVRPFALSQVALGDSVFKEKRNRVLHYAREYGPSVVNGLRDDQRGPDRMLRSFRVTAGLDHKGVNAIGSWESADGNLRGHFSGHFLTLLAQSWASTGEQIFKDKLDYMVNGLGECQDAFAAQAAQPTPRVAGRNGTAIRLSGTPNGHITGDADYIKLPAGIVAGLTDFTVAAWVNLAVRDDNARLFDFGHPGDAASDTLSRMYLSVHNGGGPRFGITTSGSAGEQRIEATTALTAGQWAHVAIVKSGGTGTIYVNGVAAGTGALSLSPSDLGSTPDNWIGRAQYPQVNIKFLNGLVDDFQIIGRGLSAEEIAAAVTAGGAAGGADQVAFYSFDEAPGPTITDSSGHGGHGQFLGATDGRRHPGFLSAYTEAQFIRLEEFTTYSGTGIWAPYYTLHKIMRGLIDAHHLAGNERALEIVKKMGDWVHSRLSQVSRDRLNRMWSLHIAGEYGGSNENLAHLAAIETDAERSADYLVAAKAFDNRRTVFPAAVEDRDVLTGIHVNQHVPQFTGYLRIFEQDTEANAEYFTAADNFWHMIIPQRMFSHGSAGGQYGAAPGRPANTNAELFQPRGDISESLHYQNTQGGTTGGGGETCSTYNLLKLTRNLYFHNPDPKYMDYYERGLTNHILGSRRDNDSASDPQVTYFLPAHPGATRGFGNNGTCCGGTGMENHTKYQETIYAQSADASTLYVNLYIASTLSWAEKGFTVTQVTDFPRQDSTSITVDGSGPLKVQLRVPYWVQRGFVVKVNGAVVDTAAEPGTYLTLDRTWAPGDRIDISMPFSLRTERALDDPELESIFHGPVVLPALNRSREWRQFSFYSQLKLDGDLTAAVEPLEEPNFFNTHEHTLRPLYIGINDAHHVYYKRVEPKVVFGSVDSGASNEARDDDGDSFLDKVWAAAPFKGHGEFVAHVEEVASEWQAAGRFTRRERQNVIVAASRAQSDLRVE